MFRFDLVVMIAAALLALPARGVLLISDSFDYPDGALVNISAGLWIHHSPTGSTGEVQVVSGRAFITQTNAEDVSLLVPGQPYEAGSSTILYAGFRVKFTRLPSGSGDYFAHFKGGSTSNYRARLFATTNSAAPGRFRLGIANGASAWSGLHAQELFPQTEYQVVLRYAISNASTLLWINPVSEADPSVNALDSTSSQTLTAFALRQVSSSGAGFGNLSIDDLRIATGFADAISGPPPAPPVIQQHPSSLVVEEGSQAAFTVAAAGDMPLGYQWFFQGNALPGATANSLAYPAATTNLSGNYFVLVSNSSGFATSTIAQLIVNPHPSEVLPGLSVLTYNVKGNGATDWSTNSPQVLAIGRQLQHLNPDIITFNEIPLDYTWEMANFIPAFLPGYYMATNSGTDGFIRSVIASRYPILWSGKWLDGVNLSTFGYDGQFTRDLFQAQVQAPGFPVPVNIFTTHLKATTSAPQNDAAKRGAEASAISNFFATVYLAGSNALQPYVLTGDLNEDVFRPDTNRYVSALPVQRLTSPPVGLRLTTPVNPVTIQDFTLSVQSTLNVRFDYILPCDLLYSNLLTSQVFRTGVLTNPPSPLLATDDRTASDHLPVLTVFRNPFDVPFRLLSLAVSNQVLELSWESVRGQRYRVEQSQNLTSWSPLASGISATGSQTWFSTNVDPATKFFRVRAGQ